MGAEEKISSNPHCLSLSPLSLFKTNFPKFPTHFPLLGLLFEVTPSSPSTILSILSLLGPPIAAPFSISMKKAPKPVAMDSDAYALFQTPKIGTKHRRLLQDYEDLQIATEVMKEELLIVKRKKSTLLAEVRFLRHRYEFLKNQSLNAQPKHDLEPPQNLEIRPPTAKKEKSSRKREASFKLLARAQAQAQAQAQDLNQRGEIYDGMEAASRIPRSVFHMNQKPRMCSDNDVYMHDSSPVFDQKERVYRVHDAAANRNMTPVFDLNQISREEDELQAGYESPRAEEELKNSFLRSENDGTNGDMMISPMCRNVGNGSNRAGKRKISWQDQVALRA